MDKDLQKIDEKIDKLASAVEGGFDSVHKRLEVVENTIMFMKDRMVTKDELKEEVAKLATKGEVKMLEGHLNVIEQKLDEQIETHKDIPTRVSALEVKVFAK